MQRLADFPRGAFGSMVVEALRLWRIGGLPRTVHSRVLRNPQTSEMTWLSFSTPCVKTGFVPKLLSRLGRDKSEGAGC
jgi:hypothetical protein